MDAPFTLEQQKILVALERKQREFTRVMCDLLKGMIELGSPGARNAERGMLALRNILVEEQHLVTTEQWDRAIDTIEEQERAAMDRPEAEQLNTDLRDLQHETVLPEQYADRCQCRDRRDEHAIRINPSPEVDRRGFALFGWFRWGGCLKCPCVGFHLAEVVMDYPRAGAEG